MGRRRKTAQSVDVHIFDGMPKQDIYDWLKAAEVGTTISGLYDNRFGYECHIEKERSFVPNYFAPQWAGGSPNDYGSYKEYWTLSGYDKPWLGTTIYDALNGGDEYYHVADEREAFMAGFDAGMNHYASLMSKRDAIDFLKREWDGDEPIYWTVGLSYRNPTTHNVPLTLEEMIEKILHTNEWIDVRRSQGDGALHVNFLSGNDMW